MRTQFVDTGLSGGGKWFLCSSVPRALAAALLLTLAGLAEGREATLRCPTQKLEGRATSDGFWMVSTAGGASGASFRVRAESFGRGAAPTTLLDNRGEVAGEAALARWQRAGLNEEYSVSDDGLRQDFVLTARPPGDVPLRVELEISGARATEGADGVKLILDGSGRKLSYGRLRVTDTLGREFAARMKVISDTKLAVVVGDADAQYPLRIDPTFTDANWENVFGVLGANSNVLAIAKSPSGDIYVAGRFTFIGTVFANYVAKWDGTKWSALGTGMSGGAFGTFVQTLTFDKFGNLYAGGSFSTAGGITVNGIAKWDGYTWSALGLGMDSLVYTLACDKVGNLYAGGLFSMAGGVPVNYIAKWNGSAWSGVGSGVDSLVRCVICDASGNLYAAGSFFNAGGNPARSVAKWNGSSWSALDLGLGGQANTLVLDGTGNLYVGGNFTNADVVPVSYVAKWNGSAWSALGAGVNDLVNSVVPDESGKLYAGGNFTTAGGVAVSCAAQWDGTNWSALGAGLSGTRFPFVNALFADQAGNVYAGGAFPVAGSATANFVAKWNGNAWTALGSALDSGVLSLAADGLGNVYAGGQFSTAGIANANSIARWNGTAWSALGSGVSGFGAATYVYAVVCDHFGNVYTGGYFTNAGGVTANYVAKWNGANWSALGSGLNGQVNCLACDSAGNVYAGGVFTVAGGLGANYIAKWDGAAWSALGAGFSGGGFGTNVSCLAVDPGGNLYAGGVFTKVGGLSVNYIAKWDGFFWSLLGTGMNDQVTAMTFDNAGNLYAGGYFTKAGGLNATNVAVWNGSAWNALNWGTNYGSVYAMAFDGSSNIFVGGLFTSAGGVSATNVAQWNGNVWSPLGSGTKNVVYALAFDSLGNLFAGGGIAAAGTNTSRFMAKALFSKSSKMLSLTRTGANTNAIAAFGTPGFSYALETTPALTQGAGWTALATNSSPTGNVIFTDITNAAKGFYRTRYVSP